MNNAVNILEELIMKKGIIMILATSGMFTGIFLFPLYSAARSSLTLSMYEQGLYTVILDNQTITKATAIFSFNNIWSGVYLLKVIRQDPNSFNHLGFTETIYEGYIEIPDDSRVYASIDRYGELRIVKVKPLYAGPLHNDMNNSIDSYHSHYDNEYNNYYSSQAGFELLRQTILDASFDSDKLKIAKQAAISGRLSSMKVLAIIELFTFESTKLSFAKFAYQYVVDRENYYIVNNAFTFSSTIDELNEYISE
ncbi:MAG: DUF4476 domain-containing protein [Bacteroidia bacterium]|nr:DUF4476 domain-containing protein [Bacteroidia bacterium]